MSTASQAQASAYWRVTQCPGCDSSFKVSPDALAAASGKVRCGACLTVFVAEEHLLEPDPAWADLLANPANDTPTNDSPSPEPEVNQEDAENFENIESIENIEGIESIEGVEGVEDIESLDSLETHQQGQDQQWQASSLPEPASRFTGNDGDSTSAEATDEDDNDSVFIGSAPTDYFDPSRFLAHVEDQDLPASNDEDDSDQAFHFSITESLNEPDLEDATDNGVRPSIAEASDHEEGSKQLRDDAEGIEDHAADNSAPQATDSIELTEHSEPTVANPQAPHAVISQPVSPEAFSLRASFTLTAQRRQSESDNTANNNIESTDSTDNTAIDNNSEPTKAHTTDQLSNADIQPPQAESETQNTPREILEQEFHDEQQSNNLQEITTDTLQSTETPGEPSATTETRTGEVNLTSPHWRIPAATTDHSVADAQTATTADNIDEITEPRIDTPGDAETKPAPEAPAEPETVDQSTEAIRARALQTQLEDEDALEAIPQEHLAALGEFSTPVQLASGRQRNWGPQILWGFVSALLFSTLAAQYFWQHKEIYSLVPSLRPWYVTLCDALGCDLPVYQNISAIRSETLAVRSHPELSNGLVVNVEFRNTAAFPQPFPILVLSFNSPGNSVIALREFAPEEYLGEDLRQFDLMPVMNPVQLDLEIIDPGPDAVNYTMAFRRP